MESSTNLLQTDIKKSRQHQQSHYLSENRSSQMISQTEFPKKRKRREITLDNLNDLADHMNKKLRLNDGKSKSKYLLEQNQQDRDSQSPKQSESSSQDGKEMIEYLKQFGGRYPNYETEDGDWIYKPYSPVKRNQKEASPEIYEEEIKSEEEENKVQPVNENISESKRKEREEIKRYLDEKERKLKQIQDECRLLREADQIAHYLDQKRKDELKKEAIQRRLKIVDRGGKIYDKFERHVHNQANERNKQEGRYYEENGKFNQNLFRDRISALRGDNKNSVDDQPKRQSIEQKKEMMQENLKEWYKSEYGKDMSAVNQVQKQQPFKNQQKPPGIQLIPIDEKWADSWKKGNQELYEKMKSNNFKYFR